VAFSPDGARVLTGSGNGTARVWEIPRIVLAPAGEQVRLACAMLRSIGYTKFSPADRDRLPILQGEPDNVCPR
jgi:WD40 repeat protein